MDYSEQARQWIEAGAHGLPNFEGAEAKEPTMRVAFARTYLEETPTVQINTRLLGLILGVDWLLPRNRSQSTAVVGRLLKGDRQDRELRLELLIQRFAESLRREESDSVQPHATSIARLIFAIGSFTESKSTFLQSKNLSNALNPNNLIIQKKHRTQMAALGAEGSATLALNPKFGFEKRPGTTTTVTKSFGPATEMAPPSSPLHKRLSGPAR